MQFDMFMQESTFVLICITDYIKVAFIQSPGQQGIDSRSMKRIIILVIIFIMSRFMQPPADW